MKRMYIVLASFVALPASASYQKCGKVEFGEKAALVYHCQSKRTNEEVCFRVGPTVKGKAQFLQVRNQSDSYSQEFRIVGSASACEMKSYGDTSTCSISDIRFSPNDVEAKIAVLDSASTSVHWANFSYSFVRQEGVFEMVSDLGTKLDRFNLCKLIQ